MAYSQSFQDWMNELKSRMEAAKEVGVSGRQLTSAAAKFGDFLAQNKEPKNPEERLLKEMWKAADEREQQAIASTLAKMLG